MTTIASGIAAALAFSMAGLYVAIMRDQDDQPAWWFLTLLIACAVVCAYAAVRPHRALLLGAGSFLLVLGFLGILTIGLPILLAGALAIAAAIGEPAKPADR